MSVSRKQPARPILGFLALSLLALPATLAQQGAGAGPVGDQLESVIAALEVQDEVLDTLALSAVRDYQSASRRRDGARAALIEAELELDRRVAAEQPLPLALEQAFEAVEAARGAVGEAQRQLDRTLARVLALRAEQREVAGKLRALRADLPRDAGVLNGVWEVSLLPGSQTGEFHLQQRGTLITGQYRLSGGWTGSLQGTFVNGQIYLERIDSQRGRDAEFRGTLAAQAGRIRGTWQAFELADGRAPHGSWVAVRRR